jgi:hypothetical protein
MVVTINGISIANGHPPTAITAAKEDWATLIEGRRLEMPIAAILALAPQLGSIASSRPL